MKIVIIHGNGCTSQNNWYPWLKSELTKQGLSVVVPNMPDSLEAKASIWLPYMKDVLKCDEQTIIIGHSSGAVAAMRYAENNKLLGTLLIGACYTDLGMASERISGYYNKPWKWDQIKANQQWIIQLASIDDPFIPIKEPRYIHEHLKTDYHEYDDQGHFMEKEIPVARDIVVAKLKKKTASHN